MAIWDTLMQSELWSVSGHTCDSNLEILFMDESGERRHMVIGKARFGGAVKAGLFDCNMENAVLEGCTR